MSDFQLTLSASERDLLSSILSASLKQKRVEVHRTEFSREFREQVEAEAALIHDLLDKLAHSAEPA